MYVFFFLAHQYKDDDARQIRSKGASDVKIEEKRHITIRYIRN